MPPPRRGSIRTRDRESRSRASSPGWFADSKADETRRSDRHGGEQALDPFRLDAGTLRRVGRLRCLDDDQESRKTVRMAISSPGAMRPVRRTASPRPRRVRCSPRSARSRKTPRRCAQLEAASSEEREVPEEVQGTGTQQVGAEQQHDGCTKPVFGPNAC